MSLQVVLHDDNGNPIDGGVFDQGMISSLTYTLVENEINALELTIPQVRDWGLFAPDRILTVERGGKIDGERGWLLTDWDFYEDEQGNRAISLLALDGNDLLDRYIVAYAAGSTYTDKTAPADNLMKAIVRENLGSSATDTARQLTGLSVAEDLGNAPSLTMAFARKNVFKTLQNICDAAWERGTYTGFDMPYRGGGAFEFVTYTGQKGVNHSASGGDPRIVELLSPRLSRQHSRERNYIYCGGQGKEEARVIKTATNTTRLGASRWARRELFADARNTNVEAAVEEQARAVLQENRPRLVLTGDIPQDGFVYGLDYQWGDVITAQYQGVAIDCRISAVQVQYTNNQETVKASVRGEL